jgi:hypothetical protein
VADAIERHRAYVAAETLATELLLNGPIADGHRIELPDGRAIHVGLHRLEPAAGH